MDTDHEVNRTRHQMKVPGLGVLIAPVYHFTPQAQNIAPL